jgi:hypothetical protein
MKNKIICPICKKEFYSLGFAAHQRKHYQEERLREKIDEAVILLERNNYLVVKKTS